MSASLEKRSLYFSALPSDYQRFLSSHTFHTFEEMIPLLMKLEAQLQFDQTEHHDERMEKPKLLNHNKKPENTTQKTLTIPGKKYCSFHKSSGHNTEDCIAKKRQNSQGSEKNSRAAVAQVTEQASLASTEAAIINKLVIQVSIKGKIYDALLDTGATQSLLSKKTADECKLISENQESSLIRTADNSLVETSLKYSVTLTLPQFSSSINVPLKLTLLPSLSFPVLIGMDFLAKAGCIIDLNKNTIVLFERLWNFAKPNTSFDCPKHSSETVEVFQPDDLIEDCYLADESESSTQPVIEILKKYFINVIGTDENIGFYSKDSHRIQLAENAKPPHAAPFRIPESQLAEVRSIVTNWLQMGIIRHSTSSFASPAFPVKKKDGSLRLVVDFRKLNSFTHVERFPMPRVDTLLLPLKRSSIFSQLDLNSGYLQIPVHEDDVAKTAFVTPGGHFEFLRMPFGLSGAPMTFQRIMARLFSDLPFVKVFLDDILVHSRTEAEHLDHLRIVFQVLAENNLTIKLSKCEFMKPSVSYLGMTIDKDCIRPSPGNLASLESHLAKQPGNKRGVRRLIGFLNFFRNTAPTYFAS